MIFKIFISPIFFIFSAFAFSKSLSPDAIKSKFFHKTEASKKNDVNKKNTEKKVLKENQNNNSNENYNGFLEGDDIGFIDDVLNISQEKNNQVSEEKNGLEEKKETEKKEITEDEMLNLLTKFAEQQKNDGNFDQAENCYKIIKKFTPDVGEKKLEEIKRKIEERAEKEEYKRDVEILFESVKNGNYEDAYKLGMIFISKNDIIRAVKILSFAAHKGNAEAAYQLAIMFQNGEALTQNFNVAQKWYVLGAKNGHPKCMYKLAEILENVIKSNETDESKSLKDKVISFKVEAAAKGHVKSAIDLGFYYSSINDHVMAQKYFTLANEKLSQNKTIKINAKELVEYNIIAEKSLQ